MGIAAGVVQDACDLLECDPQLRHAPLLGEHDEIVCRELLGLSAGTYSDLVAARLFV